MFFTINESLRNKTLNTEKIKFAQTQYFSSRDNEN